MLLGGDLDIEIIPPHSTEPTQSHMPKTIAKTFVLFDLETTSLRSEAEIVQIAASDLDGSNEFAQYL